MRDQSDGSSDQQGFFDYLASFAKHGFVEFSCILLIEFSIRHRYSFLIVISCLSVYVWQAVTHIACKEAFNALFTRRRERNEVFWSQDGSRPHCLLLFDMKEEVSCHIPLSVVIERALAKLEVLTLLSIDARQIVAFGETRSRSICRALCLQDLRTDKSAAAVEKTYSVY